MTPFMTRMTMIGAIGLSATCAVAQAETIGYWQLEGEAGTTASEITSETYTSVLPGTASAQGAGQAPVYSDQVPGKVIRSGVDGEIVNEANTTSLEFERAAEGGKNGGVVQIQDERLNNELLEQQNFTIEGFYRSDASQDFATIIAKNQHGTASWGLDTDYPGKNQIRVLANETDPFKEHKLQTRFPTNDGQWHHFALTYDGDTQTFTFYGDYEKVAEMVQPVQYVDHPLVMGNLAPGNAFTGNLDEIRYSAEVLEPDQFLRAADE